MTAFDDLQVQLKELYDQAETDLGNSQTALSESQLALSLTRANYDAKIADLTSQITALKTQTPSVVTTFAVGAASQDFPALESKSGPQGMKRVYDSGFNLDFMAACKSAGVNPIGITVVYSCKPAPKVTSASIAKFLATVPSTCHLIIEMQHEASNPSKAFTTEAQRGQLLADKHLFYSMALDAGHETIWIEMDYLWTAACVKANSWRTPENFAPGDDLTTYYGVDTYNNGSLLNPQRWDSYGYAIGDPQPGENLSHIGGSYVQGGFLHYAQAHNKPWIVTEWNTIRALAPADSTSKANYLREGADYFARKGASGICLFDSNGRTSAINGESWPLKNDPTGADYAAWASVNAKY